jgi:hypothetical protein
MVSRLENPMLPTPNEKCRSRRVQPTPDSEMEGQWRVEGEDGGKNIHGLCVSSDCEIFILTFV